MASVQIVEPRPAVANAPTDEGHKQKEKVGRGEVLQLPSQLRAGYWRMAPSFLSLLFSLARARRAFRLVLHTRYPLNSAATQAILNEFNLLCEGKHPAFDGENRTKQVVQTSNRSDPNSIMNEGSIVVRCSTETHGGSGCNAGCLTAFLGDLPSPVLVASFLSVAPRGSLMLQWVAYQSRTARRLRLCAAPQVFLDGSHGSPDLRISEDAVAVMHMPQASALVEGTGHNQPPGEAMTPSLVTVKGRCYKGPQEIYAGLMYHELGEKKALCIIHEPLPPGSPTSKTYEVPGHATSSEPSGADFPPEAAGEKYNRTDAESPDAVTEADLSGSSPLIVLADEQDLTHFHVCLSSSGVLTVVDGVSYLPTLLPVDVVTQQPIALQPGIWSGCVERDTPKTQLLGSLKPSPCTAGRLEVGAVASRIALSPWDCLTNAECLVAAVSLSEKQRMELARAAHIRTEAAETLFGGMASRGEEDRMDKPENSATGVPESHNNFMAPPGALATRTEVQSRFSLLPAADEAYLMKTVVPVLYPALQVVLRDRPEDPLASIAFYLLRHATGYSRTLRPLQEA